ncbi:MAG: hypothetical protein HQL34_02325 [Alphaproteobacteria bacterium]|nr:hypothetical protein [Alphaproteobacteria bacterium]
MRRRAPVGFCFCNSKAFLRSIGKECCIHIKKPRGKPMSRRAAAANAKKSVVRTHVEHPFAALKPNFEGFL